MLYNDVIVAMGFKSSLHKISRNQEMHENLHRATCSRVTKLASKTINPQFCQSSHVMKGMQGIVGVADDKLIIVHDFSSCIQYLRGD